MIKSAVRKEMIGCSMAQLMPHIIQGAQLGFLANRPITQTQFMVLVAIYSRRKCSLKILAQDMRVSMPTMSGIVERLFRLGYIGRLPDPFDRRQIVVKLSVKGHALMRQFKKVISRRWKDVLLPLNNQELTRFNQIINKLKNQFQGQKIA